MTTNITPSSPDLANNNPALQESSEVTTTLAVGPLLSISDPFRRERGRNFLLALMELGYHKRAIEASEASWGEITALRRQYPEYAETYQMIRETIEELRRECADDETYRRAVEGWDEPVYRNESDGKGGGSTPVIAGYIRRYSDKALEMYNRAHNRERYGAKDTGDGAKGFQYTVIINDPAAAPGVQIQADQGAKPIEMASKAHPSAGEIMEKAVKPGNSGDGTGDCVSTDPPPATNPAPDPEAVPGSKTGGSVSE